MDDSSMYFIHVGKSVSGHERYVVPERYRWVYTEKIYPSNPVVSFIIPVYNTGYNIRGCINSILQ